MRQRKSSLPNLGRTTCRRLARCIFERRCARRGCLNRRRLSGNGGRLRGKRSVANTARRKRENNFSYRRKRIFTGERRDNGERKRHAARGIWTGDFYRRLRRWTQMDADGRRWKRNQIN